MRNKNMTLRYYKLESNELKEIVMSEESITPMSSFSYSTSSNFPICFDSNNARCGIYEKTDLMSKRNSFNDENLDDNLKIIDSSNSTAMVNNSFNRSVRKLLLTITDQISYIHKFINYSKPNYSEEGMSRKFCQSFEKIHKDVELNKKNKVTENIKFQKIFEEVSLMNKILLNNSLEKYPVPLSHYENQINEQNSFVEKIIELYGKSPGNFYKIIECLKDVKLGFNEICNKLIIDLSLMEEKNNKLSEENKKICQQINFETNASDDTPFKISTLLNDNSWNSELISKIHNNLNKKCRQSKEEYIAALERYTDTLLVIIMENSPHLLEKI